MSEETFFHLAGVDIEDQRCGGAACFVARHRNPTRWAQADGDQPRVHCLGKCHLAPAVATDAVRPHVGIDAPEAVVLGRIAQGRAWSLEAYRNDGGFSGLERARSMTGEAVVAEVDASGLKGRGGAAFPVGRKWRAAQAQPSPQKYVVVNADEGDPGAYIDRVLLEEDPHAVIEGLAIAALAVGATRAYLYVRKEYPLARERIEAALVQARAAGVLGDALAGVGQHLDVAVVEGEGSYVCGEETALLNAIEGRRPEVRVRPPYPVERGLFGRPTVVNNVETLASIPWILRNGAAAYSAMGTPTSSGTKVVSLNSLFRRPGLYEVEFGLPVRDIVERLGGGLSEGSIAGLLIGGPLTGVLPPSLLDTPFDFESLRAVGCEVGHGGMVAFDENTSILQLMHHVFRFGAYESCGKCAPCREGAGMVEAQLGAALGGVATSDDLEWRDIVDALAATSLCGHGTGMAAFARSVINHYGEELDRCLT
ncbi:MAG: NADH-quinone oxidoreductase subunit D [Microthrixaceae bacterium]|nr:NADH-quinone oxidoreductase subunit D [Microthrixaceae bacterium]